MFIKDCIIFCIIIINQSFFAMLNAVSFVSYILVFISCLCNSLVIVRNSVIASNHLLHHAINSRGLPSKTSKLYIRLFSLPANHPHIDFCRENAVGLIDQYIDTLHSANYINY